MAKARTYTNKTKSTRTYTKDGPTKKPKPGGPSRPRTIRGNPRRPA